MVVVPRIARTSNAPELARRETSTRPRLLGNAVCDTIGAVLDLVG